MTTRRITVTRAQHEAAKHLLERARELGEPLDPAVETIANAMVGPTRDWPFCCDDLRGATSTGTVTNGFRDGLGWGVPVGSGLVLDIQYCPWCGHNLAHLTQRSGTSKAAAYGPVIDGPWTYGKR